MDHTVAALLVAAFLSVIFPSGVFHQLFESGDVAVLKKIARFLPTKDVEGWVTPRCAVVIHVALEEFEEVGG